MSIVSVYCKCLLQVFITWNMYSIHFSRYVQFITWNMYSIHFSRYIRFITWNMYSIHFSRYIQFITWNMYSMHFSRYIQFITWNMYSIHFSRYIRFITWNMYWIAKPFVLPLQIFRILKTVHFFGLWWKNPNENETAFAIPGRLTVLTVVRFVCVSVPPSFDVPLEP